MHNLAKYRVPLAFILTPVVATLIVVTAALLAGTHLFFDDVLVVFLYMFVPMVVVALPLFMWAVATDRLHLVYAATAGFITGALPVLILGGGLDAVMYGLLGSASAAVFWFAALFRNPFYPHAKLVAWGVSNA